MRSSTPAVRGREAVQESILAAAAELFAERGPAAVSLRAVAGRAGVNYGLVHRHFGTKDALLRRVLRREADELVEAIAADARNGVPLAVTLTLHDQLVRSLARAALDGVDVGAVWSERPEAARLVDLLAGQGNDDARDRRMTAAATAALVLGWALLENTLLSTFGLADLDRAEARRLLERPIARLQGAADES